MERLASSTEWALVGTNIAVAVGTIGVAATAGWVAIRDSRQRDVERQEREAAQARLVTSQWVYAPAVPAKSQPERLEFRVFNGSGMPVLQVKVAALQYRKQGGSGSITPVPRDYPTSDTVQPGDTWSWKVPKDLRDLMRESLQQGELPVATFVITDVSGLRWVRTDNRELVRVSALAEEPTTGLMTRLRKAFRLPRA
ncbi:hypothetical protein ACIF83_36195 [Streptomyces sp. NPDC085866]|uniref:hypothetical protein n=1 Tax=Streptomyces sp. NPDC085866 TaxID=3365736 RepID=UPI0037D2FE90